MHAAINFIQKYKTKSCKPKAIAKPKAISRISLFSFRKTESYKPKIRKLEAESHRGIFIFFFKVISES